MIMDCLSYMQLRAARSLWISFWQARYSIPLAVCRHMLSSFFLTSSIWELCSTSTANDHTTAIIYYGLNIVGPDRRPTQQVRWLHLVIVSVSSNVQLRTPLLEEWEEVAVAHIGHDNIGGRTSVHADSNQAQHIGVFEVCHLQPFFDHFVVFLIIVVICMYWWSIMPKCLLQSTSKWSVIAPSFYRTDFTRYLHVLTFECFDSNSVWHFINTLHQMGLVHYTKFSCRTIKANASNSFPIYSNNLKLVTWSLLQTHFSVCKWHTPLTLSDAVQ